MKVKRYLTALVLLFLNLDINAKTIEFKTKNGMQVLFYNTKEIPMLDLELILKSGSAYDGKTPGISMLTANLLNQGGAGKSFSEIAKELADTGAQYEAQTTKDFSVLHLKTLSFEPEYSKAISLFKLIYSHPDFNQEAIDQQKTQIQEELIHSEEVPDALANKLFYEKLYKNHPYGSDLYGNLDSIKNISREQIQNFYKKYYCSGNAVLTIVGDIDLQNAKKLAENLTNELPQGQSAQSLPKAPIITQDTETIINFPSSQTVVRIGQVAITPNDPNYFPLTVGNYILGGPGLVSKLQKKLREEKGFTYGVVSQFSSLEYNGPFVIGFSTKNSTAEIAKKTALEVLEKFLDEGPSEKDLKAAKQFLIGSFPLALASNEQLSQMLRSIAFYHLPVDYLTSYPKDIEKVSLREVKKAFDNTLKNKTFLTISVGGKETS